MENTLNIIYVCDEKYFVGMFSSLYSIIKNTNNIKHIKFHICIPKDDSIKLQQQIEKFIKITDINANINVTQICKNIIIENLKKTLCYKSGNHLLSIGNYSRLVLGSLFDFEKCLYIDSDTIVHCDIYEKLKNIDMKDKYMYAYSSPTKFKTIFLQHNHPTINQILGTKFHLKDTVFFTGTFLLNCKLWHSSNILDEFHKIMQIHNNTQDGLYRLFTMSIINIALYKKIHPIDDYINMTHDLGWKLDYTDNYLKKSDIIDWSGTLKPWFTNGLYRKYWIPYNMLYSNDEFGEIKSSTSVESFNAPDEKITQTSVSLNNVAYDLSKIKLKVDKTVQCIGGDHSNEFYSCHFIHNLPPKKYLELDFSCTNITIQ